MLIVYLLPLFIAGAFFLWAYMVAKRVSNSNDKVAKMQEDIWRLNLQAERFLLPRRLSAEQADVIAQELAKLGRHKIYTRTVKYDEEASTYRAHLEGAIRKAGWAVMGAYTDDHVREGVSIDINEPLEKPSADPFEASNPKPSLRQNLEAAFKKGGVVVDGGQGGTSEETIITLVVGPRRRDEWAVRPPNFDEKFRSRRPDSPSEEDFKPR